MAVGLDHLRLRLRKRAAGWVVRWRHWQRLPLLSATLAREDRGTLPHRVADVSVPQWGLACGGWRGMHGRHPALEDPRVPQHRRQEKTTEKTTGWQETKETATVGKQQRPTPTNAIARSQTRPPRPPEESWHSADDGGDAPLGCERWLARDGMPQRRERRVSKELQARL